MSAGRHSHTYLNEVYFERLVFPIFQAKQLGAFSCSTWSSRRGPESPVSSVGSVQTSIGYHKPTCCPTRVHATEKCSGKSVPGLCMEYIFLIIQKGAIFQKLHACAIMHLWGEKKVELSK